MMSKWAEVMTNMRPKTYFLRPDVALPLGFALVREFWNQKVCPFYRRPHQRCFHACISMMMLSCLHSECKRIMLMKMM